MKKAVILHGTDGNPHNLWLPWLKLELENRGYEVFAPELPENHTPNKEVYDEFLRNSGWDFTDNIVIGHSSGATTVLNLLSADWFPKIRVAVLVGTFLNEKLTKLVDWYDPGQFDDLFKDKYDPASLKQKADRFIFVHGDNDPYCDIEDAKKLCIGLDGEFVVIKNGHHLANSSGIKEIPKLIEKLDSSL